MVSLIVPYFLTFLGLMTGSAQDFPAFAVFLTFIGVVLLVCCAALVISDLAGRRHPKSISRGG